MTSIFEGQPLKARPFLFKTRVIWVPDIYIYLSKMKALWLKVKDGGDMKSLVFFLDYD